MERFFEKRARRSWCAEVNCLGHRSFVRRPGVAFFVSDRAVGVFDSMAGLAVRFCIIASAFHRGGEISRIYGWGNPPSIRCSGLGDDPVDWLDTLTRQAARYMERTVLPDRVRQTCVGV